MGKNNTTGECTSQMTQSPFVEPKASLIFRAVIMSFIILVSLTANWTVCRLTWQYRGRKRFVYYLLANLAIAELIGTVCYPFLFYYDSPPWSWVFGDFMCHVVNPLSVCTNSVVTFTMAAIAVYRCLVIIQPFRIGRISSVFQSAVLVFSWIWATSLALPSLVSRRVRLYHVCDELIYRCSEMFPQWADLNTYTLVLFICQHAAPLVIMVAAYGIVALKVKKHIQDSRRDRFEMLITTRDTKAQKQDDIHQISRRQSTTIEREQELLKMIYAIILIYFFCYLPYSVVFVIREFNLVDLYGWDYDYVVSLYSYLLQCFPSALHPICYLAMRRIHALDLIDLLLCR